MDKISFDKVCNVCLGKGEVFVASKEELMKLLEFLWQNCSYTASELLSVYHKWKKTHYVICIECMGRGIV